MQLWEINYFETKDAVLRKPQVWDIKVAQLQELKRFEFRLILSSLMILLMITFYFILWIFLFILFLFFWLIYWLIEIN